MGVIPDVQSQTGEERESIDYHASHMIIQSSKFSGERQAERWQQGRGRTPYKNTHLSEVQPLFLAISVSLVSEELRFG
jgi:hypothetical protein